MRPGHLLPEAVRVALPNRGTTSVWDTGPGPTAKPPLLLLHGWNIDAPANFGFAVHELSLNHRVVMFDHHGHGNGVRTQDQFTLEAAADDAVSILDKLEIPQAVVVGYSMGGAIAQLLALRSAERCAGLVLMATADRFSERKRERGQFASFAAGSRALRRMPDTTRTRAFNRIATAACKNYPEWILQTVQQADPVALLEAGAALGQFDSSVWNHRIEVPRAFVLTTQDAVVPTSRQVRLACQLDVDHLHTVDAGHDLPINDDPRFTEAIALAVEAVLHRSQIVPNRSPAGTHLAY